MKPYALALLAAVLVFGAPCIIGCIPEPLPGADSDGDGVADDVDNCPADANPDQVDGDGDGIGDACEPDSDDDGIADDVDNCPAKANPDQADSDGDGTGDLCEPVPGRAGFLFVDGRVATSGDGTTWATAYKYLQDALTAARDSSNGIAEIWVATGTYHPDRDSDHPTGTGDRTASFALVNGVALCGGFAGTEDPNAFDLADRDLARDETILSGDLAGDDDSGRGLDENAYHVVVADGVGSETFLDGFTVARGNANGTSPDNAGGGLYNNRSNVILTHCRFAKNRAGRTGFVSEAGFGGGIYNQGSDLSAIHCVFDGNGASSGSAILNKNAADPNTNGSTASLANCVFVRRSGCGTGAIVNDEASTLALVNCTLTQYSCRGVNNQNPSNGAVIIINSILWGDNGDAISGLATVSYSCIRGGYAGTGNIDSDPRLVIRDNGLVFLRAESACIDAGDNSSVSADFTKDAAGNPRLVDDPLTADSGNPGDPPRPVVDMGALEYQAAPVERIHVNVDSATPGEGRSWAAPYAHLQDALAAARIRPEVTEIWIAAGVYKPDRDTAHPDGSRNRWATFNLPNQVRVYGGFAGTEDPNSFDMADRDLARDETILSGDLAGDDGPDFANNQENSRNVVTAHEVGAGTVLDGLTITAGNFYYPDDFGLNGGGGMRIQGGSPELNNCVLSRNWGHSGGAIHNWDGRPRLVGCTFEGNSAQNEGAAVFDGGRSTLHNCTFRENAGHTITVWSAGTTLTNCLFWRNSGGVIFVWGGSAIVTNCSFEGNSGTAIERLVTTILTNSIVRGHLSPPGYGPDEVSHSCIEGLPPEYAGNGNIDADPLFVDAPAGDLRLQAGSPCIDAGNNAAVPADLTIDLDGHPRFVDDPATPDCQWEPGTCGIAPVVDMGACEFIPPSP